MPDNGYYYGIGAFETMAVEKGKVEFLDLHLARLQHAMNFFEIPYSTENIKGELNTFLKHHHLDLTGHDVLKLTISEQEHHLSLRKNTYTKDAYEKGFQVEFSPIRRNETSPLTYHKTLCYADNLMEKHRIVNAGKDEVLFLNSKGEITEGSTANIFFGKNGRLYTPPISCGLLPGIMRSHILNQQNVIEQPIYPENLKSFDRAFMTNSLMKVMPVRCIGDIYYKIP